MIINYASKHRWLKDVTSDPFHGFGENAKSKLKSTIKNLESAGITHKIEALDEEAIALFTPLYTEQISKKENPRIFDIKERTIGQTDLKYPIEFLSLYEGGIFLGGTIFSVREDMLAISFRAYKNDWLVARLQSRPAIYAEYLLATYAIATQKTQISHGKDRNPYGQNASIGLAAFKLSVGCRPYKAKEGEYELNQFDLNAVEEDVLLLEYPNEKDRITQGYLVTKRETEAKWLQVTKYPDTCKVEVIYRD